MGNKSPFIYSIIFTTYCSLAATTKWIKFNNSEFNAICISPQNNSVLFGLNDYTDKGYYKNKSFLWSMRIDSLGSTNWKLPLNFKIVNIQVYDGIILADCFIGADKGGKSYIINSPKGKIIDSLENKCCIINSSTKQLIYYENYIISGGHLLRTFDKNIYTRKIGSSFEKKIFFDGLIYETYSNYDTLIVLAVPENEQGQLSKFSIDLKSGKYLIPPKELGPVEFATENIVKIINSNTFIIDSICYKETQNGMIVEKIESLPLDSIKKHKLRFTFYEEGYIYLYSNKLNKYIITEYNEEFDDPSQISASINKNISLYSSFYFNQPESLTKGIVKNQNRDLYLEKIVK